jgi:tripartite-type tricarboxylate transporter receptor subunit TctC
LQQECVSSSKGFLVIRLVSGFFALLVSSGLAVAQGWPTERPIRLIVPFQAGSSSDTIARIVSQKLSERLGQQIVIDNRVGASSMLGTEAVARSQPDGYTLGLANTTTHASATALSANPSYDPVKDFAPVALIGSSPFVLLSAPKFPATDVAALIAMAKEKSRTISYASAGPPPWRISPARCSRKWQACGLCMCLIAAQDNRWST